MQNISIFQGVKTRTPYKTLSLPEMLEVIQNGGLGVAKFQEEVRSGKADKTRGLAATPSGTFKSRKDSHLITYNGLLNFDIDKLDDVDATFAQLAGDKYVLALWRSISGNGLTGLFYIDSTNAADHERAYKNMITYFRNVHSIAIDEKCSNISRLRFLSHDPALIVNDAAEYFAWTPPKRKEVAFVDTSAKWNGSSNYIRDFNENTDCVDLMQKYGWTVIKRTAKSTRLTRPGGSKGHVHGEVFNDNRFTNYSDHEDIGTSISCFDIFMHYEHSGNFESAKAALRPKNNDIVYNSARPQEAPLPSEEPEYLTSEPLNTPTYTAKQSKKIKVKTASEKEVELPTFPIDSLPADFQNIVAAVCNALDTPPDILACSLMMAASCAVGHSIRLKLANGWSQSAALFMALIGDSAAGKSPAMDFAFSYIRRKDGQMIKEYNAALELYENAQAEKETRGSVPKPCRQELILEDSTIEATMNTLSQNPYGVGLVVDEIAGWISSMNQYKNGKGSEEKKWLTIFDNRDLKKSTIGRGTEVILAPYVSVVGGIQPQVLHQIAKDGRNYDGFMFRFLFCIAESRKGKKFDALVKNSIPDAIASAWEQAIDNIVMLRKIAMEDLAQREEFSQSDHEKKWIDIYLDHETEAGQLWARWYDRNVDEMEEARRNNEPEKVSALTKLSICASRLILLNEVLLIGCGGYAPTEVSTQAVKSALKQIEYFKATSFYAFSIIDEQVSTNAPKKESRCDWRKIFTTQTDIDKGLVTSELVDRISNEYGKSKRTAIGWIKADLTETERQPEDDKRTRRYTM